MEKCLFHAIKYIPGQARFMKKYKCPSRVRLLNGFSNVSVQDSPVKSYDEIPRERSLPFIGTSWTFFPFIKKYDFLRRHEAVIQQYLQYGKIVRDDMTPFLKTVHIYDPQDIKEVFCHEGRYPYRMALSSVKYYCDCRKEMYANSYGLVGEQGKKWQELRSKAQKHILRPTIVHQYIPVNDMTSQEMTERIGFLMDCNGEVPDLINELHKWALESLLTVIVDNKFGFLRKNIEKQSQEIIDAVLDNFTLIYKLEFSIFKLWRFFPTPLLKKFFKTKDFIGKICEKHVKEVLHTMEHFPDKINPTNFAAHMLMQGQTNIGHVTATLANMINAGVDTTANASAFVLYFLAKNQNCQQKVYEEICNVLPNSSDPITVKVLNQCRYLKASLKESMRLRPVTHANARVLDKDIVLSGYRVPAGVLIFTENYAACVLEENFPEPLKFKPERWLRETNEDKMNQFAFLPFGFGPRSCVGRRIAEQEIWTLLLRVIQKYRLEYHYEDINAYTTIISMPDRPLRLKFVPR